MWRPVFGTCQLFSWSCLPLSTSGDVLHILRSTSALIQQSRNTYILKRRWPPGLHKKGQKVKKLRARHFVYDLVEDTNVKKKENLEVILTGYVQGVGDRGDQVSMKPNLAYNKLLLPGLAVYASPDNVELLCNTDAAVSNKQELVHSSASAERTVNVLSRLMLSVIMNKDVPWILEPWHVRASFRKAGFHMPEDVIKLPDKPIRGPDLALEMKEFSVTVTINNFEKVPVRCRIHHWSTSLSERLPYVQDYWKLPTEPLFEQY